MNSFEKVFKAMVDDSAEHVSLTPSATKYDGAGREALQAAADRGDPIARVAAAELTRHEQLLTALKDPRYGRTPHQELQKAIAESEVTMASNIKAASTDLFTSLVESAAKAREEHEFRKNGSQHLTQKAALAEAEYRAAVEGMSDDEVGEAAAAYVNGADLDTHEVDALSRELRSRGKAIEHPKLRETARRRQYSTPWAAAQAAEAENRFGKYSSSEIMIPIVGKNQDGRDVRFFQRYRLDTLYDPGITPDLPKGGAS